MIRDGCGSLVRGARVDVNYFMPPMPGMPPMNYTIPARQENDLYSATMDLIMSGPWNIIITVRKKANLNRIVFPIDVR